MYASRLWADTAIFPRNNFDSTIALATTDLKARCFMLQTP